MAGGPDTQEVAASSSVLHFSQSLVHKDFSCFYLLRLTKIRKNQKGRKMENIKILVSFIYGLVCSQNTHPPERQFRRSGVFSLCHGGSVIRSDFFRGGLHVEG